MQPWNTNIQSDKHCVFLKPHLNIYGHFITFDSCKRLILIMGGHSNWKSLSLSILSYAHVNLNKMFLFLIIYFPCSPITYHPLFWIGGGHTSYSLKFWNFKFGEKLPNRVLSPCKDLQNSVKNGVPNEGHSC